MGWGATQKMLFAEMGQDGVQERSHKDYVKIEPPFPYIPIVLVKSDLFGTGHSHILTPHLTNSDFLISLCHF